MDHAPVAMCTARSLREGGGDFENQWIIVKRDTKCDALIGKEGEHLFDSSNDILNQVIETRQDVTVDRLPLDGEFHSAKFHYEPYNPEDVIVYIVVIPVASIDSTTHVRFLSNMSHELRTPISVLNNTLMVMRQVNRQHALRKHIEMCIVAQKQMQDLVSDLLDAAVLEEGQFRVHPTLCKLTVVTSQCLANVRTLSHKHNKILFKMDILTPQLKEYYCTIDTMRYRQVLTNLLSNAEKFTESGYVKLTLGLLDEDSSMFVVKVIDTGCGIKPGCKVYQRFRTDTGTDETENYGRGLGLWITKQIVDRMGGNIDFISSPENGTVFTVKLPYRRQETIHAAEADTDDTDVIAQFTTDKPIHILVAEDRHENRVTLKALFEVFKIKSSYAKNGKECLEMWMADAESKTPQYDCIFMDCHMPVMDGYQSTKAIRAYEAEQEAQGTPRRRAYIVAATASVMNGSEKCISFGMDSFIGKPFQLERLMEIFRHVSQNSSSAPTRPTAGSYDQ